MTPNRYSLKELRKLIPALKGNGMTLFHWTGKDALLEILNSGKIYSKATLWGLNNSFNYMGKTKVNDARNGFIDYVFLGVTAWPLEACYSAYGLYGIELSLDILTDKEFFVSKVNTGYQWEHLVQEDKFSDLTTLFQVFSAGLKTTEFLVRRKVNLDNSDIVKIYCPTDNASQICENIHNPDFRSKVEGYQPMQIQTDSKPSLMLNYPNFTNGEEKIVASRYKIEGDKCYIFHPESACVLTLQIIENKLYDISNKAEVGQLI